MLLAPAIAGLSAHKEKTTMRILVTGAAGFIGMHLCAHLLALGHQVVGCDNLSDLNYDRELKIACLRHLGLDLKAHSDLSAGQYPLS